MNVDPLSRDKFSKLAAIVLLLLALSVVIAKTYQIFLIFIDLRLKIRKVKFMFTYLLSEIILF